MALLKLCGKRKLPPRERLFDSWLVPLCTFFKNRWYIRLYNSYRLVRIISRFSKMKLKTLFGDSVSHTPLPFNMFTWKLPTCFASIKIVPILYIDLHGLFHLLCEWTLERDVNGFFKNAFRKKHREETRNILAFNE